MEEIKDIEQTPETAPVTESVPADQIVQISVEQLEDHPSYEQGIPFRAASEERIEQLRKSILRNGVLSPLLVRPLNNGHYQILGGHCRKRAAIRAGYDSLPCVVRQVDDDDALGILLTDNLMQRLDGLLPSEKAFAYRMWLERLNRQGDRASMYLSTLTGTAQEVTAFLQQNTQDNDGGQTGHKLNGRKSRDILSELVGESSRQIQRYIRLTELIPELLEMVDRQRIGLQTGVELSYLSKPSQQCVQQYLSAYRSGHLTTAMIKELRVADDDPAREIDAALLAQLLSSTRQRASRVVKVQMKPIRQYFTPDADPQEISATIVKALEFYFDHHADRP